MDQRRLLKRYQNPQEWRYSSVSVLFGLGDWMIGVVLQLKPPSLFHSQEQGMKIKRGGFKLAFSLITTVCICFPYTNEILLRHRLSKIKKKKT